MTMPTESKTRNLDAVYSWPRGSFNQHAIDRKQALEAALLDVEAAEKRARDDERRRVLEEVVKLIDAMPRWPEDGCGSDVIDADGLDGAIAALAAQPGEG